MEGKMKLDDPSEERSANGKKPMDSADIYGLTLVGLMALGEFLLFLHWIGILPDF